MKRIFKMRGKKSQQCATCKNNKGYCRTSQDEKCIRFLPEANTNYIQIEGVVETPPEIDTDAFSQMFINWIESLGYFFCGGILPYNEAQNEATKITSKEKNI